MPERYEVLITVWLDGNQWGAMVGEDPISGWPDLAIQSMKRWWN